MTYSRKPIIHGVIFGVVATLLLYLINGTFSFNGIIGGVVWIITALIIPVREKKVIMIKQ